MTDINSVDEINNLHGFDKSKIVFDVEEITIIDDKKYITIYTKDDIGVITKHTKIYRIEKKTNKIT